MVQKNGNTISFDYLVMSEATEKLSPIQIGRLFKAMLDYAKDAKVPDFGYDDALNAVWPLIRPV